MANAESNIQARIMMALAKAGARGFRNNSGLGWAGKAEKINQTREVTVYPGDVVVRNARPLHAGLGEGSPDLVGWTPGGLFRGVEVKTKKGRPSKEQSNWIDAIRVAGGRAGIARSPEEAVEIACGRP